MKKIIIILVALVSAISVNAQSTIMTELSSHPYLERMDELCKQFDRMALKESLEIDSSVKAIYSKGKLKTLEQIGAVFTAAEIKDEMNMSLFNIGFDIYTIFNIVQKGTSNITKTDYYTIAACEKDIYSNIKELNK